MTDPTFYGQTEGKGVVMTGDVFVYYNDGHYELGGVGMERFDSEDEASAFIEERMKGCTLPNVTNYTVVRGHQLEVIPVNRVTSIRLQ